MKFKLVSLLTIILSASIFTACGNTSSTTTTSKLDNIGKNDSTNLDGQLADYLFPVTGHYEMYKYDTSGDPIPVELEMTCYLTDYSVTSETKEELTISGKLQNEYYITDEPAEIKFQIYENNGEKSLHLLSFNDSTEENISINIVPIIPFGDEAIYASGMKVHIHEPGMENEDLDSFTLSKDTIQSIEWNQDCLMDDTFYVGEMIFTMTDGKKIKTRDTFTFTYAPASIKDYAGEALWIAGGSSTNNIDAYYCE